MKHFLLLFFSLFATLCCFSQSKIDSLVRIGIQHHDKGEYEKAIEAYQQALNINSASALVNYELAMTYMYSGNYEKAIEHSDIIIAQNKDLLMQAYMTKASSLSNLGKFKQAIELYDKAEEKFGGNFLLYYNKGVAYAKMQDNKNAEATFIKAIMKNPNHASSHYALATVEKHINQRIKSMLGFYFFLLQESSTTRSQDALAFLNQQLDSFMQKDEDNPDNINLLLELNKDEPTFALVETMFVLRLAANTIDESKNKTPEELFIEKSEMLFTILGEMKEESDDYDLWLDFYTPFFYNIVKSGHIDVFCNYISASSNSNAAKWLQDNADKFEKFKEWVNQ